MTDAHKQKYKIIIPIYKDEISFNEQLVINNLLGLYKVDDLCIICPEQLKIPIQFENFLVERFENHFFKNISGYNKLLLNLNFYKRFENFRFILIHQLDAYLFKKELDYWCDENYDYVGSPWLQDERLFVKLFRSKKVRKRDVIFNKVGNGGLSLRKVDTFIHFIENYEEIIDDNIDDKLFGIEDVFWSLIAPKYYDFKIPEVKTAAKFALDRKPNLGMKMNKFELPFGCHGFEKSKTKPFWKKYIKNLV